MLILAILFIVLSAKPANAVLPAKVLSVIPTIVAPTITEIEISPTPTNTISNDIQKIREVVQQKVKEKLLQIISPSTSKKAILGKVIEISDGSINIEYKSETRQIQLDPELTLIDSSRNKTSISKLKIGQDILVLGVQDTENNTFVAKRIIFTDSSKLQIKKTVTAGKIVDISKSSSIITLIPSHNKNTLFQIKLDSKTEYFSADQTKIKQSDIKSGHKVVAILRPDEKTTKTYNAVRLIDIDYKPEPTPTKK